MLSVIFAMVSVVAVLVLTGALARAHAQRRHLERRLATADRMAHTDPLTGLANRAGLRRALISQRAGSEPGLLSAAILLDLDGLKPINDRYGHDIGDAVIVEVAQRIARPRARVVCAARLGGDEFVVVLASQSNPTTAIQQAERLAHMLCVSIAQPFLAENQLISITASAGVAVMPVHRPDRLLTAADLAMYRAKSNGTDVCRYQPQLDGSAEPLHRPVTRLRDKRERTPVQRPATPPSRRPVGRHSRPDTMEGVAP